MRKAMSLVLVVLFLVSPVAAADFGEMSFSDDGVAVYASASADVPWEAPFTEDVIVSISVWPSLDNLTWTRISSIVVSVQSAEADGSGFSLISSDVHEFSTDPVGTNCVNASVTVTLAGNSIGSESYFAVSVIGQYGNATDTFSYAASSPEDLLGPFTIAYSPTSPQFLFGAAMVIVFILVIVLGIWGVSRSRKRPTREALLKE
jgi:hypothetical protein